MNVIHRVIVRLARVGRYAALSVCLCAILAACTPSSTATPAASDTSIPAIAALPTATLYIMPTPPAAPVPACPGAPKERLILQERGRVLPDDPRPINLRSEAGTANRVLTQIPIRSLFYVLAGPVCEDEFAWYQIRYEEREGWIAEGDLSSYYVEPYLPG